MFQIRKPFSLVLLLALCPFVISKERPNILFIFSDDHAVQAISSYGGRLASVAPTPNIDRIAREGALFENSFCGNSICGPSRYGERVTDDLVKRFRESHFHMRRLIVEIAVVVATKQLGQENNNEST